jgi:hypothetical protein
MTKAAEREASRKSDLLHRTGGEVVSWSREWGEASTFWMQKSGGWRWMEWRGDRTT